MKKIYFASDFHFGLPSRALSKEREAAVIRWLDFIKKDAAEVYLIGDVFDYWFEYKSVVPRGYLHFFAKIIELQQLGIKFHLFTGNHDMWLFSYFQEELGIPVYTEPVQLNYEGKTFYVGHGDGLGKGDYLYKFIKRIFRNRLFQWCFARLHPNFGLWLMRTFSHRGRTERPKEEEFVGEPKEILAAFCNDYLAKEPIDYFIFGHRHLPIDYQLNNNTSRYINTGEWLHYRSYAVFDGVALDVQFFENDEDEVFG